MPVAAPATGGLDTHREHDPQVLMPFNACVARPVSRKEAAGNPKAQAALLKEPLVMELTLSKKDAAFWEKERESAKKRAAAESAPEKTDPEKPTPPKKPGPGLGGDE
jgi:hypothetical protein